MAGNALMLKVGSFKGLLGSMIASFGGQSAVSKKIKVNEIDSFGIFYWYTARISYGNIYKQHETIIIDDVIYSNKTWDVKMDLNYSMFN